nr:MAG TPA: hypothetical protein [Caudoviricetes sp.]DAW39208.1 MAG TPA: hypothetical protein [Caudoviricetes sp.]
MATGTCHNQEIGQNINLNKIKYKIIFLRKI